MSVIRLHPVDEFHRGDPPEDKTNTASWPMVRAGSLPFRTTLPLRPHQRLSVPQCVASGPRSMMLELGDAAISQAAYVAGGRATVWQLALAFLTGGLFVATVIAALALAYAIGATNIAQLKAQLRFAWRRTWDMAVTVLGAASVALLRKRIPGAPCAPTLFDDEGCAIDKDGNPVRPSRMREAWMILRTGFSRTMRTASEGVEAIKLQKQLYSAVVGQPGLKTAQYLIDKSMPLRLAYELEKSLVSSLRDMRVGDRVFELRRAPQQGSNRRPFSRLLACREPGDLLRPSPAVDRFQRRAAIAAADGGTCVRARRVDTR